MKERDLYWDTLKFVLIFLVVYGHTLETFAPEGSFNRAIYNLIYSFHMPLFVFVSGRFSHCCDRSKYKKSIVRIFETYIVFQTIRSFFTIFYLGDFTISSIVSYVAYPQVPYWYLLSLVYWRCIVMSISNNVLKRKSLYILGCAFLISIFGGFIPVDKYFSIQRTLTFLPFFFLGYYSVTINIREYINRIHIGIVYPLLLLSFMLIYFWANTKLNFILSGMYSYWSYPLLSPLTLLFYRCIYLASAIFLSIIIMRLVHIQPFLAKIGERTLTIYVFHIFIVEGLRMLVKRSHMPCDMFLLLIYTIVITLGLAYVSRIKIVNTLLNPISFLWSIVCRSRNQ